MFYVAAKCNKPECKTGHRNTTVCDYTQRKILTFQNDKRNFPQNLKKVHKIPSLIKVNSTSSDETPAYKIWGEQVQN